MNTTQSQQLVVAALCAFLMTGINTGCAKPSSTIQLHSSSTDQASSPSNLSSAPPAIVSSAFLHELPENERYQKLRGKIASSAEEQLVRFDADEFRHLMEDMQKMPKNAGSGEPSAKFQMELFHERSLTIEIDRIDAPTPDGLSVRGHLEGDAKSEITLISNGDSLVGQIHRPAPESSLEIRPVGKGAHVIRSLSPQPETEIDRTPNHAPAPDLRHDTSRFAEETSGAIVPFSLMEDPVIDMLVAYTPAARAEQGGRSGIEALILLGIADANRAFEESGAHVRVRLVGMMETKQNETSDLNHDLYALQDPNDGQWDEVHAERERLRADQVSLVGAYRNASGPSGIGFFDARPDSAFTVLRTSAFSRYTLVHELGHNLGLDHSDGYYNANGRFVTIMAYGNVDRICRFSNPLLDYQGFVTGDSRHNEARIINENAAKMAAFR